MAIFHVHESLLEFADYLVTPEDWALIDSANDDRFIDSGRYAEAYLLQKYRQGFLHKVTIADTLYYVIGAFPQRIDCCMRGERKFWDALPAEARTAYIGFLQDMDIWIAPYYEDGETDDVTHVLPLEQSAEEIKKAAADGDIFYVMECDCRIYGGSSCRYPGDVCLHWLKPPAYNTPLDRGYARKISAEEALAILERADDAGLVHSVTSHNSICNCCACCCWAFKGMDALRAKGHNPRDLWYLTDYVVSVNTESCVGCGLCMKKCQFGALTLHDGIIHIDQEKCWGCGVCRVNCPKGILTMVPRNKEGS